jgi:hypothetical protein
MYASAVRSFGIRGKLAILSHVGRWRSKGWLHSGRRSPSEHEVQWASGWCLSRISVGVLGILAVQLG